MPLVGSFIVPHPPLIIPKVGNGNEKRVQKTIDSYLEIASKIEELKPDTIIISSPHAPMGDGCFLVSKADKMTGDFSDFGDPYDLFHEECDIDLIENIVATGISMNLPLQYTHDSTLDHGTMVPLYFIRQKYQDFKLIRLGLSNLPYLDHYFFGKAIQEAISGSKRVVYVASGDLSHKLQSDGPYGFIKEGPIYDQMIVDCCSKGDFYSLLTSDIHFCQKASECGHRSFLIMSGVLDGYQVDSHFYSHEDITGVGYGVFSFIPLDKDASRNFFDFYLEDEKKRVLVIRSKCDCYVDLAYRTLENYYHIDTHDLKQVDSILLNERAGVFVTLFRFGFLRGCIGTFLPTCRTIAEEISQNAIQAATNDFRFDPVQADELDTIEIHVDVLSDPEDIDSLQDLDPKKYGVIVRSNQKRGLLLPDLEGIDTVSEQIAIAKRKAGIDDDEEISLQRFEVVRHY